MIKTKIICTIGPASDPITVLKKMMYSGMVVARLNFSHGSRVEHMKRIKNIRILNKKYRRHIRILQDLEGFRIRVGKLKSGLEVKRKSTVYLTNADPSSIGMIPFDYAGELSDISEGSRIFIDDGNIALQVKRNTGKYFAATVLIPGIIKEHKGINIPDVVLPFKGLTAKDVSDIEFGAEQGVDYIAQSFVRNKQDILNVRKELERNNYHGKLIAKIENRDGINNIDEILKVSDGIMIARGDMGVSIPIYEVPAVQKMIIRKCNRAGKPVITATQMLESMTENIRPTRAEVSDVANAVLDGSNYVMLSGETAVGKYPVETVDMMSRTISFTEQKIHCR
ncbi:MAG: pyruvate kinase [Elusimicrobia bacterium RIFOXYA2_FULL_40_6]|nr:MAG: pyruvate kinase [Elusimicrobia bacterium RIFOXYA2_FULL_40_6]